MVYVLFLSLSLVACSSMEGGDFDLDVAEAYNLARQSLLAEHSVEMDVCWLLDCMLERDFDSNLHSFLVRQLERHAGHSYMIMIDPGAPRFELPVDAGRGFERFIVYLQAAFGAPEERAQSFLAEFVSREESGYVLTHQLLALIWAEQSGLMLDEKESVKKRLLRRIASEHAKQGISGGIDLYVERAALLVGYGAPLQSDVDQWVQVVLKRQLADGSWPLSVGVIDFDGASVEVDVQRSHTTVLAMYLLWLGGLGGEGVGAAE